MKIFLEKRLAVQQPPKGQLFIQKLTSPGLISEMEKSCQSLQLRHPTPQPTHQPCSAGTSLTPRPLSTQDILRASQAR